MDLAAPGAELEHAAAVESDPLSRAVVVEVEQLAEKAEARRLDVQRPRREGEPLDVGNGMNRRVPGDSCAVWPQGLFRLGCQRRIFEPGLGEALGDTAVERNVRRR